MACLKFSLLAHHKKPLVKIMKKIFRSPTILGSALICFGLSMAITGCNPEVKDAPEHNQKVASQADLANESSKLMSIGGGLFSIPSPIQTSMLIERSGAEYDKTLLNNAASRSNYVTNFQKAINLGIYGADFGYVTIYDQSQDALNFMSSIRILSDELRITGAFEQSTIESFERNFGVRDSMLNLVSVAYRNADAFLKNNDRLNIGACVLVGGWVETIYFSTIIAQKGKDQELIDRIGEQKHTLENIIKMLQPYAGEEEYGKLLDDLINLAYDFDAININYTYIKPTTDVDTRTTTINSASEVVISEAHLKTITDRVAEIRNGLIGASS
jgi:hypothetical protein